MTANKQLSRRQFLKILAIGGAAACGLAVRDRFGLGSLLTFDQPALVHESHLIMGCVLNLTLAGDDPAHAKATAAVVLQKMRSLVDVCSLFDPNSQLSHLNASGSLRNPHPALVNILKQAETISRATQGAFDVSVKPLLDAYLNAPGGERPSHAVLETELAKIGHSHISIAADEISLGLPGMGLTLDAIAKGAVIDSAVEVLRSSGFENVIVEAGGDLMASGAHGPALPWNIGLRSPRNEPGFKMPVLKVSNMAVATSGDYLQPFAQDYSSHHILDPRKGISPAQLASVSVVAPSAMLADGLATAIMVAGVDDGLKLLGYFAGCEATLVDKHMQVFSSSGMQKYLV
jgi:thiamine biosynthesis lipoprotein